MAEPICCILLDGRIIIAILITMVIVILITMVIVESGHFVVSSLTDGERAEKESVRGNGGGGHPMPANALSTWILPPL